MKTFPGIISAALIAVLGASSIAYADEEDQERARHAVESGQAMPLSKVLNAVSAKVEGEVVGIEIDRENGRYVYEIKVITPSGQLREMLVDALTAEILKRREN